MPRRRLSRTIGDLPVTAANLADYSARVVVPTLRELIRAWNDWQEEGTVTVKVDGTTIGTRNAINLVTGTAITITGVDDSGNDEVDVTLDVSAAGGGVTVRKNTGADVGTRPRLNLIEGAGISLTVADDAGSSEVDITVTGTVTQYTDEMAQDAIGTILLDSATIDFTYDDGANTITAVVIAGGVDHGGLAGLADDDHTQYLLANGTRALTADWDAGSFEVRAQTFESDVATGTAPLVVASTTLVTNLNADLLDGQHGAYYLDSANFTGVNWTDLTDGGSTTLHTHDHGGLGGLSDDDHTQYLLLAGRAGGQTAYGGTAASENLNLNATSHATKGTVTITGLREKVAANDTLWIDAANANVFMGSADPGNVATVSGQNNTAFGDAAATSLGAGADNTAVGQYALNAVVGNSYSTAVGRYAIPFGTGTGNTGLGRAAGLNLSSGSYTVSIGAEVGTGKTGSTGDYNVLIGAHVSAAGATLAECVGAAGTGYIAIAANQTLMEADGEYRNVYIGSSKPGNYRTSSGTDNVAIGDNALGSATTAGGVTAIGTNAAANASTSPEGGVYIGHSAAGTATAPEGSVVIGHAAAYLATTLSYASIIGRAAAPYGGASSVVIGTYAGFGATASISSSVYIGTEIASSGTSPSNQATAVGFRSLYDANGATGTSAFGYQAGQNVTSGAYNLLGGYNVAPTLTTGTNNVVLGSYEGGNTFADVPAANSTSFIVLSAKDTLVVADPTSRNVFAGSSKPGNWLTASGTDNVAIGDNALGAITNASNTVALGTNAGASANPADAVLIGVAAGQNASGGQLDTSTMIGRGAGPAGGSYSTVVGGFACYGAPALSNYVTVVGASAMYDSSGATGTSAFGYQAGQNVTSGAYNLLGGYNVAPTLTTGNNCVVLGAYEDTSVYADVAAAGVDGQIVIAAEGANELAERIPVHIVVMPYSESGASATDGNVLIGSRTGNWRAGIVAGNGYQNALVGSYNAPIITSGYRNAIFGTANAASLTTGARNVIVGYGLDTPAAGTNDYMSLGGAIFGDISANKRIRFGGSGAVSQTERVAITQATADTSEVFSIETTGTNGAKTRFYVGDQSPNGTITADPGSVYFRVNGTNSSVWANTGAGSGTTWTDLNGAAGSGLTHPQVMARTFFGW